MTDLASHLHGLTEISQLDVLRENMRGWRNPEPRAARNRQRTLDRRRIEPESRSAQVIAEFEHLHGYDSAASIARRLGYNTPASLARALARWGRPDLAKKAEKR